MKAIIKREYGIIPELNPFMTLHGQWVARTPEGTYIDFDKYQNDLVPRLERDGYQVEKVGE